MAARVAAVADGDAQGFEIQPEAGSTPDPEVSQPTVLPLNIVICQTFPWSKALHITVNDVFSGDLYSGNDRFCAQKPPDDAILFTVSGITAIVEQKSPKFRVF